LRRLGTRVRFPPPPLRVSDRTNPPTATELRGGRRQFARRLCHAPRGGARDPFSGPDRGLIRTTGRAPAPQRVHADRQGTCPRPDHHRADDLGRQLGTHPSRPAGAAHPRALRTRHPPDPDLPALPRRDQTGRSALGPRTRRHAEVTHEPQPHTRRSSPPTRPEKAAAELAATHEHSDPAHPHTAPPATPDPSWRPSRSGDVDALPGILQTDQSLRCLQNKWIHSVATAATRSFSSAWLEQRQRRTRSTQSQSQKRCPRCASRRVAVVIPLKDRQR
jgi:hypothetical protein